MKQNLVSVILFIILLFILLLWFFFNKPGKIISPIPGNTEKFDVSIEFKEKITPNP